MHILLKWYFSLGINNSYKIVQDGCFNKFIEERYSSYNSAIGAKIESKSTSLEELYDYALSLEEKELPSGNQELLEAKLNQFIYNL